jgi:hypothetical protein
MPDTSNLVDTVHFIIIIIFLFGYLTKIFLIHFLERFTCTVSNKGKAKLSRSVSSSSESGTASPKYNSLEAIHEPSTSRLAMAIYDHHTTSLSLCTLPPKPSLCFCNNSVFIVQAMQDCTSFVVGNFNWYQWSAFQMGILRVIFLDAKTI